MNRLLFHICMFAALATGILNYGYADVPESPDVLKELREKLHSNILKDLCVKQYSLRKELNSAKAKSAIDFFYDLRAQAVLLDFLENKNFIAKAYAMEAIRDLAQPGDKELAKAVISRLEGLVGFGHTGGSEMEIPKAEYRSLMIETLAKVTELDAGNVKHDSDESVRKFLTKAKDWLGEKKRE